MTDINSIYRTRFYSDCIGVFQGGGCRAAAYAGAYDAAYKCGVRFSEVAGTSAGAIAAALIAAGADPPFVLEKLSKLNFLSLLNEPKKSSFSHVSKRISALRKVPLKGERLETIVKIARLGGLYSSEGLENWLEICLKELTAKGSGPVQFRDLPMPLHVVAGDLSAMTARIWSSQTTPAQSVSHAVRASCTIPLFFQPVEEGSTLLVDGGIVSNIPHFLFTGTQSQNLKRRKRVLLFMLEADEERQRATGIEELLKQLASLVVDGGSDVQLAFTPGIARIVIPTGIVRSTDFKDMNDSTISMLVSNGCSAAETFIKRELMNTQGQSPETSSIFDEHEAFLTACEQLYSTRSSVRIAMPDTRWFWELFPSVLHWRKAKVRVVAYVPPIATASSEAAKETQRRTLLKHMGIELAEEYTLPFHGMLFDSAKSSHASALILSGERSDYEPAGRLYTGKIDQAVLSALDEKLAFPSGPVPEHYPKLRRASEQELLDRLQENVQFYREPGVTLKLEEVEVSKVFLISRFVRAFRYKQICSFIEHFSEQCLELFEPAQVPLMDGTFSLVTPPVVEEIDSRFVALEGNTRFLYCFNNNIQKVKAIVVRNVKAELPGRPVPIKHVKITSVKHPPEERMDGYNHGLFRAIERAVRPLPQE